MLESVHTALPPATDAPPAPLPRHGVRLLDAAPYLRHAVPVADAAHAQGLVVPYVELEPGAVYADLLPGQGRPFAMMILDGIVLKNSELGRRVASEIFGPSDILPIDAGAEGALVVHRRTSVAILDDRFRAAARRWPRLHDLVFDQLAEQAERASVRIALLQLPRVEDRLLATFAQLADRWGRVTPGGIVIDLPLTHEMLGRLVGGRRPTVTLAMTALAEAGLLTRGPDGWRLPHPA